METNRGSEVGGCVVDAGDKATVAAILHAQPFLSGLDAKDHATLREQAATKFAPIDAAQHNATLSAIDFVMGAGNSLTARYHQVLSLRNASQCVAAAKVKVLADHG